MPEDFVTASFQTDNQNRMNGMNKTENDVGNRMNETENSQTEESEWRVHAKRKISELSNKEWSTKDAGSEESGNERISDIIKKLSFTIYELKDSLPKSSRKLRLWINYMNYIKIVKTFICAEKTGNWHLLPTWLIFSVLLGTCTTQKVFVSICKLFPWPTKTIPMVIYQIFWRGLSFTTSWQSLLGLFMNWSCYRAGPYVIHPCIRCINVLKSIRQC